MLPDGTAKEAAKAVQETAKATGTLAELAGKVGVFVSKVLGKPADQIGGVLEDQIRFYRYKNLCAIADKVQAIHKERKIDGKTIEIPSRLAIPILESAALEDDETLQGIWARLIANATDPQLIELLHPVFIEIAKQLSSDEALILLALAKYPNHSCQFLRGESGTFDVRHVCFFSNEEDGPHIVSEYVTKNLMVRNLKSFNIYMDNLERLNLIYTEEIYGYSGFDLTSFGHTFVNACVADSEEA